MRLTKQQQHCKTIGFNRNKQPHRSTPDVNKYKETATSTKKKSVFIRKRQSQRLIEKESPNGGCYNILNLDQVEQLFYYGYSHHQAASPTCRGKLTMHKTEHRIISTSFSLKCPLCKFSTHPPKQGLKMYKTINSTGRPASTLNLALGNALINSPIGITPYREIFMRLGLNPGSESGLHKLMKTNSNPTVVKLAQQSMASALKKLSNKCKGGEGVGVSVDSTYNNRPNSLTFFQAGTQSVFSVIEDESPEKKVVQVILESKLCTTKHILLKMGQPADCPNHAGCTADLKPSDSIGQESRPALTSATKLEQAGVILSRLTNDGDDVVIPAYRQIFKQCLNFKDPIHYSKCQKRYIERKRFSLSMFPGTTAEGRRRKQSRFAEDVRQRCTAEISGAMRTIQKEQKNRKRDITDKIIDKLKHTTEATIQCYKGNCTLCETDSLVCNGKEGKPWPKLFVPADLKGGIIMTPDDEELLRSLINFRLGPEALNKVYCQSSTQKNEAFNRSLQKYNPKLVTFPRMWTGRVHSTVLNLNEGFKKASEQLLECAGHKISEDVKQLICKRDQKIKFHQAHQKKYSVKVRRIQRRAQWKTLHEKTRGDCTEPGYSKGKELPLATPSTSSNI